jgi:hypothetical protein
MTFIAWPVPRFSFCKQIWFWSTYICYVRLNKYFDCKFRNDKFANSGTDGQGPLLRPNLPTYATWGGPKKKKKKKKQFLSFRNVEDDNGHLERRKEGSIWILAGPLDLCLPFVTRSF